MKHWWYLVVGSAVAGCPAPMEPDLQSDAALGTDAAAPPLGGMHVTLMPTGTRFEGPGGVVVDVPAGAVSEPTEITISVVSRSELPTLPPYTTDRGEAIAFTPHGLTFSTPIRIELTAPVEANSIHRLDDERDEAWEGVAAVDRTASGVRVSTTRFSIYLATESYSLERLAAPGVVDDPTWPSRGALGPDPIVTGGYAYWADATHSLRRLRLLPGQSPTSIYDAPSASELQLLEIGVVTGVLGSETLYVYEARATSSVIGRHYVDARPSEPTWVADASEVGPGSRGLLTPTTLHLAGQSGAERLDLATGILTTQGWSLGVWGYCIPAQDGRRALCGNQEVDTATGATSEIGGPSLVGIGEGNGDWLLADLEAPFGVWRIPVGGSAVERLIDTLPEAPVRSRTVTLSGTHLVTWTGCHVLHDLTFGTRTTTSRDVMLDPDGPCVTAMYLDPRPPPGEGMQAILVVARREGSELVRLPMADLLR